MKPAPFQYHAPKTVEEAVALLAELAPDDGRVLAGGQSLVPTMAFRLARPGHLIDINGVAGLDRLEVQDGRLFIGATVRHAAFEKPAAEGPLGQLLAEVAQHIAHRPIRTRGTFCGSIAHADPASEWCAVAACLDAEMMAISTRGVRLIPAPEFFKGLMTTALDEDELLAEVRLPMLRPDVRFGFSEFSRRAGDFAIAMAVGDLRLHEDGAIAEVAHRDRRRGSCAAPHRRGGVRAERPACRRRMHSRSLPRSPPSGSSRSTTSTSAPAIAASWCWALTRRALEQARDRAFR